MISSCRRSRILLVWFGLVETLTRLLLGSQVKAELDALRKVNVTFDGWSDHNKHAWLGLVAHYVYNNRLVARPLGIQTLTVPHDTDSYEKALLDILKRFDMNIAKIFCAVTDGASVMVSVCDKLNIPRIHCLTHRLQLPVTKFIWDSNTYAPLLTKIRALVSATKTSSLAGDALEKAQVKAGKVLSTFSALHLHSKDLFILSLRNISPEIAERGGGPHLP